MLAVLPGQDKGIYNMNDFGLGVGGIEVSVGAEIVKHYTSAVKVTVEHFYGARHEGNVSVTLSFLSLGTTVVYGTYKQVFTIGFGGTIGLDAIPFNIGFSLNKGYTTREFMDLKNIGRVLNRR